MFEEYKLGRLNMVTNAQTGELECVYDKSGTDAKTDEFIPVDKFYPCLIAWFRSDKGKEAEGDIVWKVKGDYTSGIKGWRQYIIPN